MLNAFRHHGLYRRRGRGRPVALHGAVLNAFRHHGLYRTGTGLSRTVDGVTCSTPFGITDYIGPAMPAGLEPDGLACSTPFGITDYIGSAGACNSTFDSARCSTPFGITDYIGIGKCYTRFVSRPQVLNAFRHHGLYRPAGPPTGHSG